MAICPHCQANAIGFYAKSWSSAAHPTKCKQCGGLSYIANTHRTAIGRASALLPFVALVALWVTGSLWVIPAALAAFVCIVTYEAVVFHRTPMLPTVESNASEARSWERVGLLILGTAGVVVLAFIVHRAA